MRCALYAMAAVVLCALFDKNDRFSFKHLKNAFCQAAIGSAQIVLMMMPSPTLVMACMAKAMPGTMPPTNSTHL